MNSTPNVYQLELFEGLAQEAMENLTKGMQVHVSGE
jgi:single-stranded DNA-binding protein